MALAAVASNPGRGVFVPGAARRVGKLAAGVRLGIDWTCERKEGGTEKCRRGGGSIFCRSRGESPPRCRCLPLQTAVARREPAPSGLLFGSAAPVAARYMRLATVAPRLLHLDGFFKARRDCSIHTPPTVIARSLI